MSSRRNGRTLVELMTVVVILGVMTYISIPRLQYAVVNRKGADTTARRIVTDLRRTRMLAISDAADNSDGYSLNRSGPDFEIIDLSDSTTVPNSEFTVGTNINCSGGTSFAFGPLGNLKAGSDSQLTVSSEGKVFTIDITPATGIVQCAQN